MYQIQLRGHRATLERAVEFLRDEGFEAGGALVDDGTAVIFLTAKTDARDDISKLVNPLSFRVVDVRELESGPQPMEVVGFSEEEWSTMSHDQLLALGRARSDLEQIRNLEDLESKYGPR